MHKIILVDDDRTNTTLISRLLEMDGFDVVACPDMERARLAAGNGADAFIIDCNLAHGDDGIELLKSIRNGMTDADPDIPVIMTSGDDSRGGNAEMAGATRFLVKPYSPGTLSTQLSELLEGG
jgi:two-component system chemotaxis response regulator CheY